MDGAGFQASGWSFGRNPTYLDDQGVPDPAFSNGRKSSSTPDLGRLLFFSSLTPAPPPQSRHLEAKKSVLSQEITFWRWVARRSKCHTNMAGSDMLTF